MAHKKLLCSPCSELLTLLDKAARCSLCFAPSDKPICPLCVKDSLFMPKRAYACECYGPVKALLSQSASSLGPDIIKTMGSLMTVQLCRLQWDLPDIMIPIPGKNSLSKALALQMASFLPCEVQDVLKRQEFWFSEEGLILEPAYFWKKRLPISDKKILLVEMSSSTDEELKKICRLLYEGDPEQVCKLSFTAG